MRNKPTVLVVGFLLILSCISLVGVGARQFKNNRTPISTLRIVNIKNRTQSLKVLSIVDLGEETVDDAKFRSIKLTVQNGYDKGIVAYSIRKDANSKVTSNGATTGFVLAPGATDTVTISLRSEMKPTIILSAVLLEDSMGDGDADVLAQMRDYRLGVKIEFEQLIDMLHQALNTSDHTSSLRLLKEFHSQISGKLGEKPKENISLGQFQGQQDARQQILVQLRQVEEHSFPGANDSKSRIALDNLASHIESLLAKL